MEAKFGLRIRDPKPSDTGLREHSDPIDVLAVSSLSRQEKEKGASGPRVGCCKCDGAQRQRHYDASKNAGKQERWQAIVRQRQSRQVMVQQ